MSEQKNGVNPIPDAAGEHKRAVAEVDGLVHAAKKESDELENLKRRAASVVFRCGEKLSQAKEIALRHRINWYNKLDEFGIAKSTASQAIKLYNNVIEAGYTGEDLEKLTITEAKIEFGVIRSPAQIEVERKLKAEEEAKKREEERINREERNRREMEDVGAVLSPGEEPSNHGERPDSLAKTDEEPSNHGERPDSLAKTDEEPAFGEIEISDLLTFRKKQLLEEALHRWNRTRKSPYEEEYLLFLLDLGVLWVENDNVHYMAESDESRGELVDTLTDKLTPVLERWTTHDELLTALTGLVSPTETGVPRSQAPPKRRG